MMKKIEDIQLSKDIVPAEEAIEILKQETSRGTINAMLSGEERKTVLAAGKARLQSLPAEGVDLLKDMKPAAEAIQKIQQMKSISELKQALTGEERKDVLKAAESRAGSFFSAGDKVKFMPPSGNSRKARVYGQSPRMEGVSVRWGLVKALLNYNQIYQAMNMGDSPQVIDNQTASMPWLNVSFLNQTNLKGSFKIVEFANSTNDED